MDRLLDRFGLDLPRPLALAPSFPLVNVWEDADAFHVEAELPGLKQEDLQVTVTQRSQVTIQGERKAEHEETEDGRFYRELQYGRFERTVRLPGTIDPDTVSATYRNGVLEISTKAPAGTQPTRVPVTTA